MSVLRNRSVAAVLVAHVVSVTGTFMTFVALPWFVLTTTGSAADMGLVMAAGIAPIALLGVPAGIVVDRLGIRRVLVGSDLLRAGVMAAIPTLTAAHLLSFPLLLALVVVNGALAAAYAPSQRVVLPLLVGEDEKRVGQANAFLQGAERVAGLAGPALGGLLIAVLSPLNVLLIDAASYLASFALLALFLPGSAPAAPVSEAQRAGSGVLAGVRFLLSHRLIGPLAASTTIMDTAFAALIPALPVLVLVRYHRDPRLVGIFLSAFSGGVLLGTGVVVRLLHRYRPLALAIPALPLMAGPLWVLVAPVPWPAVVVAMTVSGAATGLVSAPLYTVVTLRIPEALRNRAMTSYNAILTLAHPVGYAVAGVLLAAISTPLVLTLVAATASAAATVAAVVAFGVWRHERQESVRAGPAMT